MAGGTEAALLLNNMTKKIDEKKKIGGVDATERAREVAQTEAVKGVQGIKPTAQVGGISGVTRLGKRGPTRIMSSAERDQLFKMIEEEADKLFGDSEKAKEVKEAVKMAVDVGLVDEDEKK